MDASDTLYVAPDYDPGKLYKVHLKTLPSTLKPPPLSIFTPNGDGINDETDVQCYPVDIVNRNGVIVKSLTDTSIWNGQDYNGNVVPLGFYIAICRNSKKTFGISVIR
jgi:hypothetical protein